MVKQNNLNYLHIFKCYSVIQLNIIVNTTTLITFQLEIILANTF
jgi:hypothetical protein